MMEEKEEDACRKGESQAVIQEFGLAVERVMLIS